MSSVPNVAQQAGGRQGFQPVGGQALGPHLNHFFSPKCHVAPVVKAKELSLSILLHLLKESHEVQGLLILKFMWKGNGGVV